MGYAPTLELPYPRLVEGRFASIDALTDEDLLAACGVRIAFTERTGGLSAPPYDCLNVGDHVQDEPELVAGNRARLLSAFDACGASVVNPLQVHGDRIVEVSSEEDADRAIAIAREGADSVVVSCDGVAALLCFADCMPVIVVSPDGSFAVVHAGWRGVCNRIAVHSVESLARLSGVDPAAFNVYIGPYIRSCHFRVDGDLPERFAALFGDSTVIEDSEGVRVDLGHAMRVQLGEAGIDSRRIADAGFCTVCSQERFFSYRGSGGTCGRHGAFAVRSSSHATHDR